MDPFNIVIKPGNKQIDLNIHPQEGGTFKVVYHGALIGEVFVGSSGENWEAVTAEQFQPGGFPVYEFDETSGHEEILLNFATVQDIGKQIALFQNRL